MVHYQRNNQSMKKGADIDDDDDCSSSHMSIVKPKFFYLLFLSLISCSFILAAHLFTSSTTFSLLCMLPFSLCLLPSLMIYSFNLMFFFGCSGFL